MRALALIMIVACAQPRPLSFWEWATNSQPRSFDVRVTEWPEEPEVNCYLAEDPTLAELHPWPDEADVFRRTMTPRREHDDLIGHVNDLHQLVTTMRDCMLRLMDRTRKARD